MVTLSQDSLTFAGTVINGCLELNRPVIVEEIQLDDPPLTANTGGLPPRAALVITCLHADDIITDILQTAKEDKLMAFNGEPQAKRVKRDETKIKLYQIAACLKDQCFTQGADEDEINYGVDDLDEMSVQDGTNMILSLLGTDKWLERIETDWVNDILFGVLKLKPALELKPFVWTTDELVLDLRRRIIGQCSPFARHFYEVVRPCFANFAKKTIPHYSQLQLLCDWVPRSLAPLLPVLLAKKYSYSKAVEALQGEYHHALLTSPHAGTGVDSAHRSAFETSRSTSDHIIGCQRCLSMFTDMKKEAVTNGLFGVYRLLADQVGANVAKSMAALMMMLSSQTIVGNVDDRAIAVLIMLIGPTSVGKSFLLEIMKMMLPTAIQRSESSKSNQADLTGSPLANIPGALVVDNRVLEILNEFYANSVSSNLLTGSGDAYVERTTAQPLQNGIRVDPVSTIGVWYGRAGVGSTNSMTVAGVSNPAVAQRFLPVTGMHLPNDIWSNWSCPIRRKNRDCAQILSHSLLSSIDIQHGGLNYITNGLYPPLNYLLSAFEALDSIKEIVVRTMTALRSVIPSAFIADMTSRMLLSDCEVTMTQLLLARAMPVPLDFVLQLLQTVSGFNVNSEHITAIGRLGMHCDVSLEKYCKGYALITSIEVGNTKSREELLMSVARECTPDAKLAAGIMTHHIVSWRKRQHYGVSVDLLTMQPPKSILNKIPAIFLIFDEMIKERLLLVDSDEKHVYLPHSMVQWLNCQDGQNISVFDRLCQKKKPTSADISFDRKVYEKKSLSDADNIMLTKIAGYLSRLDALREAGLVWALLHSGAEYPRVAGTSDYPLDPVLDQISDDNVSDQSHTTDVAAPCSYRDLVYDGHILKCIEQSPAELRPLRIAIHFLSCPSIGVLPSLKRIAVTMPLPGPIEIALANNGRFIFQPRDNTLRFGKSIINTAKSSVLDVCVHPNDQLGDSLTCFDATTGVFLTDVYNYIMTLYALIYCAAPLLRQDDVSDNVIQFIAPHIKKLPLAWTMTPESIQLERRMLVLGKVTTTVRMFVLALVTHSLDISGRVSYPTMFVSNLVNLAEPCDLVPATIEFIVSKLDTKQLVCCSRETAQAIYDQSVKEGHTEYLKSTIASFPPRIYNPISGLIDKWYAKLHANLTHRVPPSAFYSYRDSIHIPSKKM